MTWLAGLSGALGADSVWVTQAVSTLLIGLPYFLIWPDKWADLNRVVIVFPYLFLRGRGLAVSFSKRRQLWGLLTAPDCFQQDFTCGSTSDFPRTI